jgi:hypothetical protein
MPISADGASLSIVAMTGTPPVVPVSPVFITARMTGETVNYAPTTTVSNELDPSGQVRDSIVTGGETTGEVSFEISDNDFLEAAMSAVFGGQWVADELVPANTLPTYLVEKRFPGIPIAGDVSYQRFPDSVFSALNLAITPGSPLTGSVSVSGGVLTLDTSPLTGATYPSSGDSDVLSPTDVTIAMDAWGATSCFGTCNLTFENGARGIECIGTLGTATQVRGRFSATIEAEAYYSNDAPLQELLDQTGFPVQIVMNDLNGDMVYTFDYPNCKLTAAPVNAAGTDTDVVLGLSIQALYDSAAGYTCKISRAAIPVP